MKKHLNASSGSGTTIRKRTSEERTSIGALLIEAPCILIPILAYLWFTLPNLELPGPYTDELFFAPSAMELAGYEIPQDFKKDINLYEFKIMGKSMPVMAILYLGMVRAYFQALVFWLVDPSVAALRGFHLLLGTLGILSTYAFARIFFRNRTAGVLAALFLAFDPTYVLSTRMDSVGFSLSMVFRCSSLLLLFLWWTGRARHTLYGAALLAGLAFSDKAIALWFFTGLLGAGILLYPRRCLKVFSRLSWKDLSVTAVLSAAGGCFFLAWYGPQFGEYFGTWVGKTLSVQSSSTNDMILTLQKSGSDLLRLMVTTFSGYLRPEIVDVSEKVSIFGRLASSFLLPLSVATTVFVPLVALLPSFHAVGKKVLFLLLAGGLVFVQILLLPLMESPFDLKVDYHHLLVTYPLFHVATAGMLGILFSKILGWKRGRAEETDPVVPNQRRYPQARIPLQALVLLIGLVMIVYPCSRSAKRIMKVHRALEASGGKGLWSDTIYRAESFLEDQGDIPVFCADWGINRPLLFLSKGKIRTLSPYHRYIDKPGEGKDNPEYIAYLEEVLNEPELLIMGHARKWTAFQGAQEAVEQTAKKMGITLELKADFSSRDGDLIYIIWSPGGPRSDLSEKETRMFREAEEETRREG